MVLTHWLNCPGDIQSWHHLEFQPKTTNTKCSFHLLVCRSRHSELPSFPWSSQSNNIMATLHFESGPPTHSVRYWISPTVNSGEWKAWRRAASEGLQGWTFWTSEVSQNQTHKPFNCQGLLKMKENDRPEPEPGLIIWAQSPTHYESLLAQIQVN